MNFHTLACHLNLDSDVLLLLSRSRSASPSDATELSSPLSPALPEDENAAPSLADAVSRRRRHKQQKLHQGNRHVENTKRGEFFDNAQEYDGSTSFSDELSSATSSLPPSPRLGEVFTSTSFTPMTSTSSFSGARRQNHGPRGLSDAPPQLFDGVTCDGALIVGVGEHRVEGRQVGGLLGAFCTPAGGSIERMGVMNTAAAPRVPVETSSKTNITVGRGTTGGGGAAAGKHKRQVAMWPAHPLELCRGVNDTWNSFQRANKGRTVTTVEWKTAQVQLWAAHEKLISTVEITAPPTPTTASTIGAVQGAACVGGFLDDEPQLYSAGMKYAREVEEPDLFSYEEYQFAKRPKCSITHTEGMGDWEHAYDHAYDFLA